MLRLDLIIWNDKPVLVMVALDAYEKERLESTLQNWADEINTYSKCSTPNCMK